MHSAKELFADSPLCVVPREGKENAKTGVKVSWFAMKG